MKNRLSGFLLIFFSAILLVACTLEESSGNNNNNSHSARQDLASDQPLRIVAATELEDLSEIIGHAAEELGFPIELTFPSGTIENSHQLKAGAFDNDYDATWFATNRYVELLSASHKLGETRKIAHSPVAFGMNTAKAQELNWDKDQPTWAEIGDAAAKGQFSYGMTDPASSNSGFSALVSVATALADSGQALSESDINQIKDDLQGFLSGQSLTSGSSGWLKDTFLENPGRADAIINYESVLHSIVRDENLDITVVVPADGVVSADYPLSVLASAPPEEEERTKALADWLVTHPEVLTDTFRRPVDPTASLPEPLSSQLIIEAPFPGDIAVTNALIAAFNNELRVPGSTTFVLDTSGSMAGARIESLQTTMKDLISGTSHTKTGNVSLRERESVSIIPFSFQPYRPVQATIDQVGGIQREELGGIIDELVAAGETGIYDALISAFNQATTVDFIPSIVLMTDGELTAGASFVEFQQFYAELPPDKRNIPVFVILYGEANVIEMNNLVELTGGKTFDALSGNLEDAFKEIRAYQ